MTELYGLTRATRDRLQQLMAQGGKTGRGGHHGAEARGVTWVKVTGTADDGGWYPGVVSLDNDGTFEDLTDAVKVAPAGEVELEEDVRYLCTRTGDDEAGARFRAVAFAGESDGGGGGGGNRCAWLKAILESDCWQIDQGSGDPIPLPGVIVIGGEEYPVTFNGLTQTLTIGEHVGELSGCDCPCLTFAFIRTDFYPEEEPAESVCDRQFTVTVCQTCCSIDGWDGPGWYCVREAGTDDPCEPAELLLEDRCDDTIEICSGPYEDEDAANEVCGTPPTCTDVPIASLPGVLNWEVIGTSPGASCALGLSGTLTDFGFITPRRFDSTSWFDTCGESYQGLNFQCESGVFKLGAVTTYGGCDGTTPRVPAVSGTADPFSLTFNALACWFMNATGNPDDVVKVRVWA